MVVGGSGVTELRKLSLDYQAEGEKKKRGTRMKRGAGRQRERAMRVGDGKMA